LIEAQTTSNGIDSTESSKDTGWVKSILVKFSRRHEPEPARQFIADSYGSDEFSSRTLIHMSNRKSRRNNRAAWVQCGFQMRVVELENQCSRTVDERSTGNGCVVSEWNGARLRARERIGRHILNADNVWMAGGAEHASDNVDDAELGAFDDQIG
jgi:hypothetical protein